MFAIVPDPQFDARKAIVDPQRIREAFGPCTDNDLIVYAKTIVEMLNEREAQAATRSSAA